MKGGISRKYSVNEVETKEISDGELIPDEIESTQTFRNEKLKIMRSEPLKIRARATVKLNKHPE
jgi:hypothetical protein